MRTPVVVAALLLVLSATAIAQVPARTDTTVVFEPSTPTVPTSTDFRPFQNSWGADVMLSNNGFAFGSFFRHEFTDELSGTLSLFLSDVKDDAEVERFSYYGDSYVLGKKNRLLMLPLMAGVQYRLFRDDIVDNFRPYVTAGLGPTMIFVAPYARTKSITFPSGETLIQQEQVEFFTSLKYGQAHYTIGGYIGGGAYFGIDRTTITGLSFRYYYVPFPAGIEVMEGAGPAKRFGGFYISLHVGGYF